MTEQQIETVEKQNEIRATGEPLLTVRTRTQCYVEGWVRYMGETFDLPQRLALGLIGTGLADQVIDSTLPVTWMQSAPGPHEPYDLRYDFAVQGSREGGTATKGGVPGDQQTRQQAAAQDATDLQPQTESTLSAAPGPGQFSGAHPPRQPVPASPQAFFPARTPPAPVRAAPRP